MLPKIELDTAVKPTNTAEKAVEHSSEKDTIPTQNTSTITAAKTAEPILSTTKKPLKNASRSTLGVSLKDLMEDKEVKEEVLDISNLPNDDFTLTQFTNLWDELLEKLEKENNIVTLGAIKNVEIKQAKPHEITFLFHTNSSKAEFDKLKLDWLADVKKQLNNFHLEVVTIVEVTENNQPNILQPEDIYKLMADKNPLLNQLRKDLGLDFYA